MPLWSLIQSVRCPAASEGTPMSMAGNLEAGIGTNPGHHPLFLSQHSDSPAVGRWPLADGQPKWNLDGN